jgi:formylglycine-generating enzyme required for sulfatase activity
MRWFFVVLVASIAVAPSARAQTPGEDDGAEVQDAGAPPPGPSASGASSAHAVAPPLRGKRIEKDGMILIPSGRFTMGSSDASSPPNEKPAHAENVGSFWIDKNEVAVAAYRVCVTAKKCAPPRHTSPLCTWELGDEALPISCVRFSDADSYCRHVGKRLPHEVEWEYAARGAQPIRYPWGGVVASCAAAATLLNDATGRSCTGRRPSHVGARSAYASPFGVLDMSGNVEEWTATWYVEHVVPGATPHTGASHVLRGGGWLSAPSQARTSSRNWGSALEAGPNVGFRCAKDDSGPDARGR